MPEAQNDESDGETPQTQAEVERPSSIELREHGEVKGPYDIPEEALGELEDGTISDYVNVEFDRSGNVNISPSKYVGVASLPGDIRISIQPKARNTNFLPLLRYAQGADASIIDRHTTADSGRTFLESIAELYFTEIEKILRLGLYSNYRRREDTSKHLRGKLDRQRQVQKQAPTNAKFEIEYDEFTTDIPLNQALYQATDVLHGMVEDGDLSSRLTLQKRRLRQHITPRNVQPHELAGVELTRLNDYYEDAVRIAEMVLRNSLLGHREARESTPTYGFFIDMNDFFEKVVERAAESVVSSLEYRMDAQEEIKSIVTPEISMRPDVVLRDGSGEPVLIMDAKWKTDEGVKNQDIYQMVSYQLTYNVPGLLLYPGHGEGVDTEYSIHGDGKPPLYAKTLPTNADVSSPRDLIENLENELRGYVEGLVDKDTE